MVGEAEKWVLTHTKIDPYVIAKFFDCTENECWDYLSELSYALREEENKRDETAIRNGSREWADSLVESYETKRLLLVERLQKAKAENSPDIQNLLTQYKVFTGKLTSLTPEQIERARNYPLKDLLETEKNITNCPFHDDKTASLNIKNNFYFCHGCDAKGDTIKFLMQRDGSTFREAVVKLQ